MLAEQEKAEARRVDDCRGIGVGDRRHTDATCTAAAAAERRMMIIIDGGRRHRTPNAGRIAGRVID